MHRETGSFDPPRVAITTYQSPAELRPGCNTKPMLFEGFLCGLFPPSLEYPEIPTRFSWRLLSLKYPKSSSHSNGCSFYPSRPCSLLQASADIGLAAGHSRLLMQLPTPHVLAVNIASRGVLPYSQRA